MTRHLFQNNDKIAAVREVLDAQAYRTEAAEDVASSRIIAGLQQPRREKQLHRVSGMRLAAFVVAVAFGTIALFLLMGTPNQSAQLTPNHLKTANCDPVMVTGLMEKFPEYKDLQTSAQNGAKFVMTDASALWVSPGSRLRFRNQMGDMKLQSGRLLAQFTPRKNPTVIQTPNGAIQIVGTVFSVTVAPLTTTVRLFEGKVIISINGMKHAVPPSSYVRLERGRIVERRDLDASDIISALLIPEQTFHLEGPKVPALQLPAPLLTHPVAADTETVPETKKRSRRRRVPTFAPAGDAADVPSPDKEFETPPTDDMEIRRQPDNAQSPSQSHEAPTAEELLKDACDSLKSGEHKKGKAQIQDYLERHPHDRYWEHVHSIFE